MNVVFESTDSGTTVVITHSGFGDGEDWEQALEATSRGVDETIADLVCYLETGVGVRKAVLVRLVATQETPVLPHLEIGMLPEPPAASNPSACGKTDPLTLGRTCPPRPQCRSRQVAAWKDVIIPAGGGRLGHFWRTYPN